MVGTREMVPSDIGLLNEMKPPSIGLHYRTTDIHSSIVHEIWLNGSVVGWIWLGTRNEMDPYYYLVPEDNGPLDGFDSEDLSEVKKLIAEVLEQK